MSLRPKAKILISVAGFFGVFVLFVILIICPLVKEISRNSRDFVLEKERLDQIENEMKNHQANVALYKTRQADIEKIDKLFVRADMPIEFMSFLEDNALKSQLDLELLSVASPLKKEIAPWPSIYFQLRMTGPFPQCLRFLERIENGPYLINIIDLNIKRLTAQEAQSFLGQGKGPALENVSVTILIEVFSK